MWVGSRLRYLHSTILQRQLVFVFLSSDAICLYFCVFVYLENPSKTIGIFVSVTHQLQLADIYLHPFSSCICLSQIKFKSEEKLISHFPFQVSANF